MPIPPIITRWQNANERWAQRRCAELGIPYEPVWKLTPQVAASPEPEKEEVILQWAEMNADERAHWSAIYPELKSIPAEMLVAERARLRQMRDAELQLRICGRLGKPNPPPVAESRLTSAAEVAEAKRAKRKKAS